MKVTGGYRFSEVCYSGSYFHCAFLLRDVFSKVDVAILKRLYCYYYSKRVGGHLYPLLVLGQMRRV